MNNWREGFSDRTDNKAIAQPNNTKYMKGWRNASGMEDAYNATPPQFKSDLDYWDGYQDAAFERWCHLGCWKEFPCDR
jgi:hypothetical protein